MRISKTFPRLVAARAWLAALLVAVLAGASISDDVAATEFTSPDEAQQQGISAFNGGYYELAIPPLRFAASENRLLAQFYLGELFADNNSPHTDHAKAYVLFQTIVNNYADVDPSDRSKAPYVARALTALARYHSRGLSEIGVARDPKRAAEYLHHGAIFFNDEDAQFELAKRYLKGDGVVRDVAKGKHWLATLAKKGHAGAQAFLADLFWRGKIVNRDPVQALALISVAVKNAPARDRVWIEDTYQNIYCGASSGVRAQVDGGMVAKWDKRFGRKPSLEVGNGLGLLSVKTHRACDDGRTLPLLERRMDRSESLMEDGVSSPERQAHGISADAAGSGGGASGVVVGPAMATTIAPSSGGVSHGFAQGSALGVMGGGLRNIGERDIPGPAR